jgi:predicted Zn-dependent peptidase
MARIYPGLARLFGRVPAGNTSNDRKPFGNGKPFRIYLERNNWQTHTILGSLAYDRQDDRRIAMFLLNNLLGGPALNSRLNLAVRERHGYTYNIESVYLPYTDTGVFSIYMGTDSDNLEKALSLVEKELEKVRRVALGTLQLHQAKRQLIGQIAIANESNLNRMLAVGKTYLQDDRADTMEEIREKIEAVSQEEILQVANEVLAPERLSLLVFSSSDPPTP